MKDPTSDRSAMSRKEFLRAFATLVAYAAPAVAILDTLGCAGAAPNDISDGGSNCSVSGTSISCSSASVSISNSDAG